MPDGLNQISVMTRRMIATDPDITDNLFNSDPGNYMLRETLKEDFQGGNSINETFLYDVLPGGAYARGQQLNIDQKQTEQQAKFDMKYYYSAVTLYSEDFKVLNRGDLAAIKLLKARVEEGFMGLGAKLAISQYLNGTTAGYTKQVNGFAEALNDGVTQAWDGNVYTSYGENTRNGVIGGALNSTPLDNSGGLLDYPTLNNAYYDCFNGSGEWTPNVVLTTPKGYAAIQNIFQTQQRFTEVELGAGFTGMRFNGATILASRYCPGSDIIQTSPQTRANKVAVDYLSNTSDGAILAYPTGNLGTGESLIIGNFRKGKVNMYISTDGMYNGGFRDFVPEANSTKVTGLCLIGVNITVRTPFLHKWIYNFAAGS